MILFVGTVRMPQFFSPISLPLLLDMPQTLGLDMLSTYSYTELRLHHIFNVCSKLMALVLVNYNQDYVHTLTYQPKFKFVCSLSTYLYKSLPSYTSYSQNLLIFTDLSFIYFFTQHFFLILFFLILSSQPPCKEFICKHFLSSKSLN